jgi:uncharacterized damage-inducible protein DinB
VPEITALLPKGFLERQGVTFQDVQVSLERARAFLKASLEHVPDGAFHTPISPGKWSPAEIADHVIKANHLFAHALEIGLRRTVNPSLEILQMPRGHVTDDGRAIAPTEEEPARGRERDALNADLEKSFAHLVHAAQHLDDVNGLRITCVDQSFFGPMNGHECLQLIAWHTAHHAKQLPTQTNGFV